ncbi:MAG: arginine--tRNA ligase [Candidatus Pacebacteria bacterium]|nr:arginine--tRNA ligase [Candidatus Paceibacterota bacterium]
MKQEITKSVEKALDNLGITNGVFKIDYPDNAEHGDFSCNAAMAYAKQLKLAPKVLADNIVEELNKALPVFVESVAVAGPGFINFKVKDVAFAESVIGKTTGKDATSSGKKVMVEYTDPNPFKVFHIGHLMSNAIGESISRLIESGGAEVIRACYQGDVGLHVAKTIWAIQKKGMTAADAAGSVTDKVRWLGEMYVYGSQFDEDAAVQKEIAVVNKKIFEKSDPAINEIYEQGRKWSLEYFDIIYKRLGTDFKQFFFESEVADDGIKVVREFLKEGVFSESEGAIVFKGEDHGLHTRVFITSQGLPTYEAKEIGLNIEKFRKYPDLSESVIITANEQNDYFRVLLKAFSLIDSNVSNKTKHISHGIMRFAAGKMSSRKGNIVSAEELIADIRALVIEKIADREFSPEEKDEVADMIAIGAIKYTILRQATGGDVIFDSASSISFEGDSGPYLQYAVVRANAVLGKVVSGQLKVVSKETQLPEQVTMLEKLLSRYADIKERARAEYAPQAIAQYLMSLAGAFNGYYAVNQIVDDTDPLSPYRVALTKKFVETMTDGLWLLGIKVPKRM